VSKRAKNGPHDIPHIAKRNHKLMRLLCFALVVFFDYFAILTQQIARRQMREDWREVCSIQLMLIKQQVNACVIALVVWQA
jgi:hypothetical protein